MHKLAENRWFPLAGLMLTMAAGALWQTMGGRMGWRPLALALSPVIARVGANKRPFPRTPFDGWIVVLLATAVLGVFTAYSGALALQKLQIILAAILIFYAQAAVSRKDIWRVTALWGAVGAGVAAYALATQNWTAFPAEFGLLNRFGLWWMGVRPYFRVRFLHPNAAGGLIAMIFPLQIVFWRRAWRRRNQERLLVTGGLIGFTLFGLLMTSSRGAWVALAAGLGCWAAWQTSRRLEQRLHQPRRRIFAVLLLILTIVGVSGLMGLSAFAGMNETASRLALMGQAVDLAQDFAITGSGLATFPALYAQYMEVAPVFVVQYSNFYLDLLLELGWPGLVAMAAILTGSFLLLMLPPPSRHSGNRRRGQTAVDMRWAVFVGLVVLVLQGLFDDHLFGGTGTPFLLVWPGLAVFVSGKRRRKARPFRHFWLGHWQRMQLAWGQQLRSARIALVIVAVVGVALGAALSGRSLFSQWQADLGALAMAQVELPGWPTGEWDDGRQADELTPAMERFEQSLRWSPTNRTALHRLGLIAMLNREYETAVAYLEAARQQDETHRGITKSLAYSYIWAGTPEKAMALLPAIPEAGRELRIYTDWWQAYGRSDLADQAEKALSLIHNQSQDE